MCYLWFILLISCNFAACQCPATDTNTGLEKFLISVLYKTLTGSCSEVNQMDPLFIESIQGQFATFQYSDINNTVTGLNETSVTSLKISEDNKMTAFKLYIPSFTIVATHNASGYLLYVPANGINTYIEQNFGKFSMKVYAQLIQLSEDSRKYLQFGNFSLDARSLSPLNYNIETITNGEDVSEEINAFRNDNWEDMTFFSQQVKGQAIVQKLLEYANEYLQCIAINCLLG